MIRHPGRKVRRASRSPVQLRPTFTAEPLEGRTLLTAVDVLGYHNDAASTGQNLSETALTPANVNTASFGKSFSTPVDGQVYAQPLYVANQSITGGSHPGVHNVTYLVTEHDSLYAIDADAGTVLWQDSFLIPSSALTAGGHSVAVSTVTSSDVNTSDITPEIGITSTPAIDPTNGSLYLTAKTKQIVDGVSTAPHFVYNLYKVDIASGAFTGTVIGDTTFSGGSYTYNSGPSTLDSVTGPNAMGAGKVAVPNTSPQQWVINFNALRQMNRSAVTLYNGNVYLGFASHGDNNPYHGWILGYSETTLAPTAVFNDAPDGDSTTNSSRDGIWMAGGRIAIDPQGFMYVMTGNGTFDTTLDANGFPINGDYGDSFIKLQVDSSTAANPNINGWGLKVVDYFTPHNQGSLSSADQDLGSGGVMILPDSMNNPQLLVGAGKQGLVYIIDRTNMGKFDPNTDHVAQTFSGLGGGGSYDTPAFFNDGTTSRIYYVPVSTTAKSYTFSPANGAIALSSVSTDAYGSRCATTSISANGTANGIAWNIDPGTNQLRAYNATNYQQELWTSAQAGGGRDALGIALKFTTPTITNGQVFVGTSNALVVYGLLTPPTTPPNAPQTLTAAAVSGVQIGLNWVDNSNNEAGFYVEESTGGSSFTRVATASANATSYLVSGLTPATSYTFRVQAFNVIGTSGYTNTAAATTLSPPPAVNFSNGFTGAGSSLQLNGTANKIVNGNLQLTDGAGNEASSAFYTTAVSVTRFTSTFTIQQQGTADGMTFTIQNAGTTAVGGAGSSLAYAGMANSVALKFDIFSNAGEGTDSTGVFTNGANPSVTTGSFDMTSSGVVLRSADVMLVQLSYDGTTLSETITDTITQATYSHNYAVNIPSIVGANTALVGFTGATGGSASTQSVQTWSFTPLPDPPAAPSNLTVTPASGTELDLSWTQTSTPVDHFNILKQTSPNTFTQIGQVPGNVLMYPDGGLSENTSYTYEVVAVNAGGSSAPAGPVSGTTPIAPVAPDNLVALNVTATGVTLTWRDNANNEDGYKLARQLESDNSIQLSPLPANATQFIDTGLIPGSVYSYTVDAYNIAGPSEGVNVFIVTLPAAPSGFTAVGQSGGVQLNWTAPKGASSYNVYRGTSPGGEGASPIATGIANPAFTDTGLAAGATYYYKVAAVDETGEGDKGAESSGIVSTTTVNASSVAGPITLVQDPDHLHVDWTLGTTGGQLLITEAAGLTINSSSPDQPVTLTYTNGNPLPAKLHLNGAFTVNGLTGANPLAGTTMEIGQSTVFINYAGSASPASVIRQYLANGYNAGAWNGAATAGAGVITSSAAANGPAGAFGVGYADSADGAVAGQTPNTIEIRYTVMGDANLDRVVNSTDSIVMARNYLVAGKTAWDLGNFNYDSIINMTDAQILQKNYNLVATGSVVPAIDPPPTLTAPTTTTPTTPPNSGTPSGATDTTTDPHKKKQHGPKSSQLVSDTKATHNR